MFCYMFIDQNVIVNSNIFCFFYQNILIQPNNWFLYLIKTCILSYIGALISTRNVNFTVCWRGLRVISWPICAVYISAYDMYGQYTHWRHIRTNEGMWYDTSRAVTLKYTVYIYDQRGNVNIYTIPTWLALFFSVQIFAHVCSSLSLIRAVIKIAHLLQCRIFFYPYKTRPNMHKLLFFVDRLDRLSFSKR